ncbi:hypothetical protein GCM10022198_12140 [Klugiella xanthotipulae]|uniref:Uncharacterized protein n=1 Tax=Klugiella xanthotipulae TaxID=244735 RepID=A0A543I3Y0_9MICO|nr:hypothetical protein [Klugiella xanthotipulae]TQM65302.1 hypothetical protein FB466_0096 [Klugiella xanthotipulae]
MNTRNEPYADALSVAWPVLVSFTTAGCVYPMPRPSREYSLSEAAPLFDGGVHITNVAYYTQRTCDNHIPFGRRQRALRVLKPHPQTMERLRFERNTRERIDTTMNVLLGKLTPAEAAARLGVECDEVTAWVSRLMMLPTAPID